MISKEDFYNQRFWLDPNRGKHPASGSGKLAINNIAFIETDFMDGVVVWKVVNPFTHDIKYFPFEEETKATKYYNELYENTTF